MTVFTRATAKDREIFGVAISLLDPKKGFTVPEFVEKALELMPPGSTPDEATALFRRANRSRDMEFLVPIPEGGQEMLTEADALRQLAKNRMSKA